MSHCRCGHEIDAYCPFCKTSWGELCATRRDEEKQLAAPAQIQKPAFVRGDRSAVAIYRDDLPLFERAQEYLQRKNPTLKVAQPDVVRFVLMMADHVLGAVRLVLPQEEKPHE